jgi:hypothetical protein
VEGEAENARARLLVALVGQARPVGPDDVVNGKVTVLAGQVLNVVGFGFADLQGGHDDALLNSQPGQLFFVAVQRLLDLDAQADGVKRRITAGEGEGIQAGLFLDHVIDDGLTERFLMV